MILDWARIVLMQMVRLLLWMLVTMLPSMPRLATSKVFTSGLFVVKTPPDLRTTAQSEQEKMWINKEDPSA